jgi:C1A family cysteine protease
LAGPAVNGFGEPSPVDWREASKVSPVMNEGSCDSDWAISTATVMETRGYIRSNSTFNTLSVQQLIDCATD